jgi:hypothetical protein
MVGKRGECVVSQSIDGSLLFTLRLLKILSEEEKVSLRDAFTATGADAYYLDSRVSGGTGFHVRATPGQQEKAVRKILRTLSVKVQRLTG